MSSRIIASTTSLFRNLDFFQTLKREVIPYWQTFPKIRIWHAGCSTGEEAYSLLLLLEAAQLLRKATIYATDMTQQSLQTAREGWYPLDLLAKYQVQYQQMGLQGSLNQHLEITDQGFRFVKSFRSQINFFQHNLLTDSSFQQFHGIFCRNLLIYYSAASKQKIFSVLEHSLPPNGFLGLGQVEDIQFLQPQHHYRSLEASLPLYQRKA